MRTGEAGRIRQLVGHLVVQVGEAVQALQQRHDHAPLEAHQPGVVSQVPPLHPDLLHAVDVVRGVERADAPLADVVLVGEEGELHDDPPLLRGA